MQRPHNSRRGGRGAANQGSVIRPRLPILPGLPERQEEGVLGVVIRPEEAKGSAALDVMLGGIGPASRAEDEVPISEEGLGVLAPPQEEPNLDAVASKADDGMTAGIRFLVVSFSA